MDEWDDITRSGFHPGQSLDPACTVAYRAWNKGRPVCEVMLNSAMMSALRWVGGQTRVRVLASKCRTRLALRAGEPGKQLRKNNGRSATLHHRLDWVVSQPRPAERVQHWLEDEMVVVELPAWARPAEGRAVPLVTAAPPPPRTPAARPQAKVPVPAPATAPVPVPVPAPPPAQAADHDARPRWTPERDDALRGAWFDLSVPLDGVAAPVNALDGPRTNKTHIARRAHEIGLPARSEVHAAARARDEAERIAAIDAGTAPPPPRPVQATPRAPETQALIEEARAVAAPVSPGGVDKLTPPREALFRRLWQDTSVRTDDILTQVNALPGPHYTTARGLYAVADRLGLPGTRGAAPAPRPRVATRTEEEIRAQDEREAEALIRIDPERRGAKWVSEEYGWPLDRAQRLVARVRAAIRAEQQGTAA